MTYIWPIVAAMSMGLLLNLWGVHLAARDKTLQSLCLSQGAILGLLVGMAFSASWDENLKDLFPFFTALFSTAVIFFLSERNDGLSLAQQTPRWIVLYASLLAFTYVFTAFLPGVEVHMIHKFFGDLATLSDQQAQLSILVSGLGIGIYFFCHRTFTQASFDLAVLNIPDTNKKLRILFLIVEFVSIAFGVMAFGLLFTIACLFVASTILSTTQSKPGLLRHMITSSLITVYACGSGFVISLLNSRLPTVPTIVICALLIGGISRFSQKN